MTTQLAILNQPAVAERTSAATRRVLLERVQAVAAPLYFAAEEYAVLRRLVGVLLPQDAVGTDADVAAALDQKLANGLGSGWRFADLPVDGEAYRQGLAAFASLVWNTHGVRLADASDDEVEGCLKAASAGAAEDESSFPLRRWMLVLKTDAVRAWMSHPSTMERLQLYGFADGATGNTNGATEAEGWQAMKPNQALPFEHVERGDGA